MKRHRRISRLHDILKLMWRSQLRRVALLEAQEAALSIAEHETLHHFESKIPLELTISRLRLLYQQRLNLTEELKNDKTKACALVLKLKRVEKLLAKLNEPQ